MPAQGVDERAVPHEPVFVDMATKMHELVNQIHARGCAHEQPTDIWRGYNTQHQSDRNRHQDENHQRIGRENRHPPIFGIAESHFLIGEKLMMIEGMALIDRPQPFDVHRTMHDESVHRPLEDVGEQERQRHGQPFQPGDVVNVRDVNIERRAAHRVDDQDMDIAVIPADDPRAVFLAKRFLPFGDHVALL